MLVRVSRKDLETVINDGSIIRVTGTEPESGQRVTFAGDHRAMSHMLAAAEEIGEVSADVEGYQVLSTQPKECTP